MPKQSATIEESDIPVGTQFSAQTINLKAFCEAAVAHVGDPTAFHKAIWKSPIRILTVKKVPTKRRRTLPIEAAVQYGLLDNVADSNPTETCKAIAAASEADGHRIFAKHILFKCNGLAFVSMLRTMLADDAVTSVTADTIARYSTLNCGLRLVEHNTAHNTLRMFLARAGVFPLDSRLGRESWTPDADAVEALVGDNIDHLEEIASLKPHQQAFIRALCTLDEEDKWFKAGDVRLHAENLFPDVQFSRVSVVSDVLKDLKTLDLVEYTTSGTSGGKSAKVKTTATFKSKVLDPFLAHAAKGVGRAAEKFLRMPASEIRAKFDSSSKHEKGVALEALAIRVMRALGLDFNKWRVRAEKSGYAEVDVSLTGVVSCLPTKWQVQCKNTPSGSVGNEDIAREVGIATVESATHVLFLANANYTKNARDYARGVHRHTSLTVFLLDKTDLAKVLADFSTLTTILRSKARGITEERKRQN